MGNIMNPSRWFGGDHDRYYDRGYYGYGGPYGGYGPWGYGGYGGPYGPWGGGYPGYGYGAPVVAPYAVAPAAPAAEAK